jgi:hypothetical protein
MRKKQLKFRPLDDFLNDKSLVESEKEDHGEDRNFFTEQEKKTECVPHMKHAWLL